MTIAEIAAKAKVALPDSHGRIDAAVKMALAGDVELLPEGQATVASQSDGATTYHIANGECTCRDFPQAPSGFCKHRLSAAIYQRATDLVHHRLETGDVGQPARVPALPEAPASVNTFVTIAGRQVQVTLRDTDEARLLIRLEALLQRYPAEAGSSQPGAPGVIGGKFTVSYNRFIISRLQNNFVDTETPVSIRGLN
jgi:hypothetical protein